jgi:hypothetical protein
MLPPPRIQAMQSTFASATMRNILPAHENAVYAQQRQMARMQSSLDPAATPAESLPVVVPAKPSLARIVRAVTTQSMAEQQARIQDIVAKAFVAERASQLATAVLAAERSAAEHTMAQLESVQASAVAAIHTLSAINIAAQPEGHTLVGSRALPDASPPKLPMAPFGSTTLIKPIPLIASSDASRIAAAAATAAKLSKQFLRGPSTPPISTIPNVPSPPATDSQHTTKNSDAQPKTIGTSTPTRKLKLGSASNAVLFAVAAESKLARNSVSKSPLQAAAAAAAGTVSSSSSQVAAPVRRLMSLSKPRQLPMPPPARLTTPPAPTPQALDPFP